MLNESLSPDQKRSQYPYTIRPHQVGTLPGVDTMSSMLNYPGTGTPQLPGRHLLPQPCPCSCASLTNRTAHTALPLGEGPQMGAGQVPPSVRRGGPTLPAAHQRLHTAPAAATEQLEGVAVHTAQPRAGSIALFDGVLPPCCRQHVRPPQTAPGRTR